MVPGSATAAIGAPQNVTATPRAVASGRRAALDASHSVDSYLRHWTRSLGAPTLDLEVGVGDGGGSVGTLASGEGQCPKSGHRPKVRVR